MNNADPDARFRLRFRQPGFLSGKTSVGARSILGEIELGGGEPSARDAVWVEEPAPSWSERGLPRRMVEQRGLFGTRSAGARRVSCASEEPTRG